jgi:hypothetical protein
MAGTDPRIKSGDGHDAVRLSSSGQAQRGKGSHDQARRYGFPSPPMTAPSPAGNDTLADSHRVITGPGPVIPLR